MNNNKGLYLAGILFLILLLPVGFLLSQEDQKPPVDEDKDGLEISLERTSTGDITSGDNAPPGSIHNLPVPAGVAAARQALAARLSIDSSNVLILTAFERDWPNSCLGLERAGEFCAQVITPGYEVTMRAQGQAYVYRTNLEGSIVRAEN